VSCLLEKELPFAWALLKAEDSYLEFPMNHIAYSLIGQEDTQDGSQGNEADSELQRIEYKVNLILQMLGQMMRANTVLPEKTSIQLGADEIAWHHPAAVIDQNYRITLYLNEDHGLPIDMLVKVKKIDSGWCHAQIGQQRADEQSAWERWVFRQHRRNIAIARAQPSS